MRSVPIQTSDAIWIVAKGHDFRCWLLRDLPRAWARLRSRPISRRSWGEGRLPPIFSCVVGRGSELAWPKTKPVTNWNSMPSTETTNTSTGQIAGKLN